MSTIVSLDGLRDERYGRIICYPKYAPRELETRINEMKRMGIKALSFEGKRIIAEVPVLGKGYTGIVVLAILRDGSKVALKIRRTDAEPERIVHEARMLQIANSVNVGPRLLGYTENLLAMNYIEGLLFPEWVRKLNRGDDALLSLRRVLKDLLEQCWRLDAVGLDHGELSRAERHIIVDVKNRAHLLDFESASDRRRTANLTSISQYLFIRSGIAGLILRKMRHAKAVEKEGFISALRFYKRSPSRENFEHILNVLGL